MIGVELEQRSKAFEVIMEVREKGRWLGGDLEGGFAICCLLFGGLGVLVMGFCFTRIEIERRIKISMADSPSPRLDWGQ